MTRFTCLSITIMFLSGSFAMAESSSNLQVLYDLRAALNQKVATFYQGSCSTQGQSRREIEKIENVYFPLAAKKYTNINRCEKLALQKMRSEGPQAEFSQKVIEDIAMKLPSLRVLKSQIDDLNSKIDEMYKVDFTYSAREARFGPLTDIEIKQRSKNISERLRLQAVLAPKMVAFEILFTSIWRSQSSAMTSYLNSLISSQISIDEYRAKAIQGAPWLLEKYISGNYSFFDRAVSPMISEAEESLQLINSQISKTSKGAKFTPNFSTRQILVSNMDMLYSSTHPSQKFKNLACHLDQKYISGDAAIKQTLAATTLFAGVYGKALSAVFNFMRLQRVVKGSQYVAKAANILAATTVALNVEGALQSSYEACHKQFEHMISGIDQCNAQTNIEDIVNYEYRKLAKGNCALSVLFGIAGTIGFEGVADELANALGGRPEMAAYIAQFTARSRTALNATNKAIGINSDVNAANDFIDLLMNDSGSASKPKAER